MSNLEWLEEELFMLLVEHRRGRRIALFEAIQLCGQCRAPLPDWVRQELQKALDRYNSAEAWEFGEAFGIVREKYAKQPAERQKQRLAARVYWAIVEEHRKTGKGISLSLCQGVGNDFGISASVAYNYYREIKKRVEDEYNESDATD